MKDKYDVIVLGLGAMGSATLYQLAKRGVKVLGIDQFSPPHTMGSSHGDTRITRLAIGEGVQYTPLALRSHEIWREIESLTGKNLLTVTGGLMISSTGNKMGSCHVPEFFFNTLTAAKKYDIHYDFLEVSDIRKRFPQFRVHDDDIAYYEYESGFLRPEECISTQLTLAKQNGAELRLNEKVLKIETNGHVSILTENGSCYAERLIITAGAWMPQFLGKESKLFTIHRQVLHWFKLKDTFSDYTVGKFPVFIWGALYGFPATGNEEEGMKIAFEENNVDTNPDIIDRNVSEGFTNGMYENHVAPYFPGISSICTKTAVCMYTATPDMGFVIDKHPDFNNVTVVSPCSGHGFKHSAAIGEAIAEGFISGESKIDLSSFKFERFIKQKV
jgi:sarcosine oxidase